MAETRSVVLPLEIRAPVRLGLGPPATMASVSALGILGAIAFAWLLPRLDPGGGDFFVDLGFATRVAVVASITLGYSLGIWLWTAREQYRDLRELGIADASVDPETDPRSLYAVAVSECRSSRLAGAAGIAFFVLSVEVPGALAGNAPAAAWTSLHPLSYMLLLGVLFFWVAGRAAYFSIGRHRLMPALERLSVDLLDPRPLRVFGRMALRNAFVWVAGTSISALALANPELRIRESLLVLVPVLGAAMAVGTSAMLLPMRGLHARIRAAKEAEIARVERAIRGDPKALSGSRIAGRRETPGLADLIAYRGLVEQAPEWPVDASSFRRLGLYLLIPLGSWVGGALVERLLALLLD